MNAFSVALIMRSKKTLVIILGVVSLLGCFLVLTFRPERRVTQDTQRAPQTTEGPWFEIAVEAPLFNSRPPWGNPWRYFGNTRARAEAKPKQPRRPHRQHYNSTL
jgi:hypothetical protein